MPSCWTRTTCVPVTCRIGSREVSTAIVGLLNLESRLGRRGPSPATATARTAARLVRASGLYVVTRARRDTPGVCGRRARGASWARVGAQAWRDAGRRLTMTARSKNHDWLAQTVETALEPDLTICDPHHHLWDQNTARTASRYLIDEIVADVSAGHNIVSTVFIECGAMFNP